MQRGHLEQRDALAVLASRRALLALDGLGFLPKLLVAAAECGPHSGVVRSKIFNQKQYLLCVGRF